MDPIYLLATGRSGTTHLMRLLSGHRRIVAHEIYPLECRISQFALFPRDPKLREFVKQKSWRFENDETLLYTTFKRHGVLSMKAVERIYSQMAAAGNKTPSYFAEKFGNWLDLREARMHVPGLRTICLIRDPRDVLVSARAFDKKRGFHGFRERYGDTDEMVVLKYKRHYEQQLSTLTSVDDVQLVRYEQLVTDPETTLGGILGWLGIESDSGTVKKLIAQAQAIDDGSHCTAPNPKASIGRWRNEMPVDLQNLYASNFGQILACLGYQT